MIETVWYNAIRDIIVVGKGCHMPNGYALYQGDEDDGISIFVEYPARPSQFGFIYICDL